jgi:DNA-directed RNA polymerase specialized sigma24 family protein
LTAGGLRLLTLYAAATETGVARATIAKWVREGHVPVRALKRRGADWVPLVSLDDVSPLAAQLKAQVDELRARRRRAVHLYVAERLTTPRIGEILGVSAVMVSNYLEAEGIPRRRSYRTKYEAPDERSCRQCGEPFTPEAYNVAVGGGRFCSRACSDDARAKFTERRTHRVCARVGCERTFRPHLRRDLAEGKGRFCSAECSARHRWTASLETLLPVIRNMPSRARSKWLGRMNGRKHGRVGGKRPVETVYPEKARQALELQAGGMTIRDAAEKAGLTKRELEGVIARARVSLSP